MGGGVTCCNRSHTRSDRSPEKGLLYSLAVAWLGNCLPPLNRERPIELAPDLLAHRGILICPDRGQPKVTIQLRPVMEDRLGGAVAG